MSNALQIFFLSCIIRLVNLNDHLKFRSKFLANDSFLSDLVTVSYILFYLYTAEYLFHNIFTICSSSLLSFHRFTVVSFKLLYLLNVVNYNVMSLTKRSAYSTTLFLEIAIVFSPRNREKSIHN